MPYSRVSGSGSTPEGLWVEDHGDWASIVETTDLDSACGEPGYLLERGAVRPRGSLAEWRTTFEPFWEQRRTGIPREVSRAASWSEVWTYGRRDVDESAWGLEEEDTWDRLADLGIEVAR